MDPLTIAGLGMQGIGFLNQLLNPGANDRVDSMRRNIALRELMALRSAALSQGAQTLGQQAAQNLAGSRAAVAQRLASQGRTSSSDINAALAPIEGSNAMASSQALRNFVTNTNNFYDQQTSAIVQGKINRPLPLNPADVLGSGGQVLTAYGQNREGQDAYRKLLLSMFGQGAPSTMAPGSVGAPTTPATSTTGSAPFFKINTNPTKTIEPAPMGFPNPARQGASKMFGDFYSSPYGDYKPKNNGFLTPYYPYSYAGVQ